MKRICNVLTVLLCGLLLAGCGGGDVSEVGRSIGTCERFSKREVSAAMDEVERFFRKEYDGCKLLRLEYDEEKTLEEAKDWSENYMWAFDMQSDWDYVDWVKGIFGLPEEDVYYVELIAPQEVRLERNATENRLKNKASKRNIEDSNSRLIRDDQNWRCESYPGEITHPNYLRIENADIPAAEAARMIREHFKL